ncbi:MAG: hypothetical protein KME54_03090 [Tolypothrix brevis GSE-NOS-MK-07-07A]|jgi:hypothetical protein|nr:hypothetical protein [Tolypothrix brevis GSE-NOS-MK-07-07A]
MRIDDRTGIFSQPELQNLEAFVSNDLLSTEVDVEWLDVIRIRDDGRNRIMGYWTYTSKFDADNQINGFAAVIVLNYFYVRTLAPQQRLDTLKKVLAHEYGHHWTLCYLLITQRITHIFNDPMPIEYYELRGLNNQDHACDYSRGWDKCDKEIITEDYRVLFAPEPYNQDHQMINNTSGNLAVPTPEVKRYIENMSQDYIRKPITAA